MAAQQEEIHRGLLDIGFDLGLVNYLQGEAKPPGPHTTELLRGRPVAVVRADGPPAAKDRVTVADLLAQPLVVMRSGTSCTATCTGCRGARPALLRLHRRRGDGQADGRRGLGATVPPHFSVRDDPLERSGLVTCRASTARERPAARSAGPAAHGRPRPGRQGRVTSG